MKIFNRLKALLRLQRIRSKQKAKILAEKLSSEYRNAKTPQEKEAVVQRFVINNF